jgi:hypothetical protein
VHLELAVGVGCAGHTGESISTASRAKLLVHILCSREARVAAFDE